MTSSKQHRLRLSGGTELAYATAGDPSLPALLLLHGYASSSQTFRHVIPGLARATYLIAPDLPGHGQSEVLPSTSFPAFADAVAELLDHLAVKRRFIYLHDFGAPVGLRIAMQSPELVSGLIIQNANAHRTGFGPGWKDTFAYWSNPTPQTEAAATVHMTPEGTRDQYLKEIPADITVRIKGEPWVEDWNVLSLPGRKAMQSALLADYKNYAARFGAVADYLSTRQPPAIMIWGRHDIYFDLAETLSWMQDLPRMEAHILDAGHFVLETHASQALPLMTDFIHRASRTRNRTAA
jgi:pimeloyl-ACP methyl ester carboxylesterase